MPGVKHRAVPGGEDASDGRARLCTQPPAPAAPFRQALHSPLAMRQPAETTAPGRLNSLLRPVVPVGGKRSTPRRPSLLYRLSDTTPNAPRRSTLSHSYGSVPRPCLRVQSRMYLSPSSCLCATGHPACTSPFRAWIQCYHPRPRSHAAMRGRVPAAFSLVQPRATHTYVHPGPLKQQQPAHPCAGEHTLALL